MSNENPNGAPTPRANSDADSGRLPATRETFQSDAEYQQYQTQYDWRKSQTEKSGS